MSDINRALSALNFLDPGCDRKTWLKILMASKAAGIMQDDVLEWSRQASNFESEKSFCSAWKSIDKDGPVTEGTLYHMAREQGWREPLKCGGEQAASSQRNNIHAQRKYLAPAKIWAQCVPATADEPYIVTKEGIPDGIKVYPVDAPLRIINGQDIRGYLAVPCWDGNVLQTIQFVPPGGGDKLNLAEARFGDGFFTVGEMAGAGLIYIGEGVGVAWSAYKSTGFAAVACFSCSRMMHVAKILREKYPLARLVVLPDREMEQQAAHIAAAVGGCWVELPPEKPKNYDANDYALEYGHDALEELLTHLKIPEMRFKPRFGDDLCNSPPMRWLLQGVLPSVGLAVLYGPSGSGKSFLALAVACAIAAGCQRWFGLRITKAPVMYVCLEGEAGMGKRIKAWKLHHNQPFPPALQFITQPFHLMSDDDISGLAKTIVAAQGAGGVVIIDTLSRAAPGEDENSPIDMGNIIAASSKLQSLIGGLVLLVHHTGKDVTKGMRGHTSLYAALDGAIETTKSNGHFSWSVAKSKDDVTGNAYRFRLKVIHTGFDDEGHEITSCVAEPDESIDVSVRRLLPPRSGNQKIILDALGELFRTSREYGHGGCPAGKACIRLNEAIEKTRGRLPCEQRRQNERTQAAIQGLVSRGLLCHGDGWLWGG